jgi:hypothetical protein
MNAQVTIGYDKSPESFSILELVSNSKGLRLPQMTTAQRQALVFTGHETEAMGLQIFNTSTKCFETWNGTAWIAACVPVIVTYNANGGNESDISVKTESSYVTGNNYIVENSIFTRPNHFFSGWNTQVGGGGTSYSHGDPINLIADLTLYAQWDVIPVPSATLLSNTYVGAFWRNNQTGERLIRIPVGNLTGNLGDWSAFVVDGNFIKMDLSPTTDPNIDWTDASKTPADMNTAVADAMHQVSGNATIVQGTVATNGYIYFRIGLTSVNPDSNPRYGRILLRYNNNTKFQFLYIRQGEAADYVFTSSAIDNYNGTNARTNARKFSPYNLTNTNIVDGTLSGVATGVATNDANYKGTFVDYPTKAGAFFQWGMNDKVTYAYHPTNPASGGVSTWSTNYTTSWWNSIKGTQETCPSGWRRPNDGITDGTQGTSNNVSNSEMRQSLYYAPKNSTTNMDETGGRAWGYYADGYFDRRPITFQNSSYQNTTVSPNTKDVAYIGTLFFNSANGNRSLFMPAGGYRYTVGGTLNNSGISGSFWTSSSVDANNGWDLAFTSGYAGQACNFCSLGCAVRCVQE